MDEFDLRVYRSLVLDSGRYRAHKNVRKTNLAIAKELGVDEGTIRNRLVRMTETGFIRGRHVVPDPLLIGKVDAHVRLEVLPPSFKEDVIRKVELMNGVYMVRDYLGNALGVDLFCDDERTLQREIELISRLANAEDVVRDIIRPGPKRFQFTEGDLAIVHSVSEDPAKPYHLIAKEVHLSTNQVRRRMERMMNAEALIIAHSLDYKAAKGIIKGDLMVYYKAEDKARIDADLLRVVGDRILVPHLDSRSSAMFTSVFRNVSEQREMLTAIKQIKGVEKAYFDIVVDQHYHYEVYLEAADRQISEAKALVRRN